MHLRHTHLHPPSLPDSPIPYTHALHIQSLLTTSHLAHKSLLSSLRTLNTPSHLQSSLSLPPSPSPPPPTLLTFQTNPTYTTGRRETPLLHPSQLSHLTATGATHHSSTRGGLTTYHGPGQLTAFLILSLTSHKNIHRPAAYVSFLETSVQTVCASYGVKTLVDESRTNPGVWTDLEAKRKICSVGVHLRRGVSSYGVGLNVEGGMVEGWFGRIVACGIEGVRAVGLRGEGALGLEERGETEEGGGGESVREVGGRLADVVARGLDGVGGVRAVGEGVLVGEVEREEEEWRRFREKIN